MAESLNLPYTELGVKEEKTFLCLSSNDWGGSCLFVLFLGHRNSFNMKLESSELELFLWSFF